MGFWGTLAAARSTAPLSEVVAGFTDRAGPAGRYAGGWQVVRIFGEVDTDRLIEALRDRAQIVVFAHEHGLV